MKLAIIVSFLSLVACAGSNGPSTKAPASAFPVNTLPSVKGDNVCGFELIKTTAGVEYITADRILADGVYGKSCWGTCADPCNFKVTGNDYCQLDNATGECIK